MIKWFGVVILAGIAAGIVMIGTQKKQEQENQQKKEQLAHNTKEQASRWETLQEAVLTAFIDEEEGFLSEELEKEQVVQWQRDLSQVKEKELSEEQQAVEKKLEQLSEKINLQTQIQTLFGQKIENWQELDEEMPIKKDITDELITSISDSLSLMAGDDWQQQMKNYVELAQKQLDLLNSVQEKIDRMIPNGTVSYDVNYYEYLELTDQVNEIKNQELKEAFNQAIDNIAAQFGW